MKNAVFWGVALCGSCKNGRFGEADRRARNDVGSNSNRSTRACFLQESHGVTSQKTAYFIVTAVKSSNLARLVWFYRGNTQV
jgi:hypothetical protein